LNRLTATEAIAPEVKKKIIGIRPGEKIHEILMTCDESRHSKEFDNGFIIEPEHSFWDTNILNGGKKVAEGFVYSSDSNSEWLTQKELKRIIAKL